MNVTDCFPGSQAADVQSSCALGSTFAYLPPPMCRIAGGKVLSKPHCLELG